MSNFSRYDDFALRLKQITAHFAPAVRRWNDAVVVFYPEGAPDARRSIGVKRLLTNYYRPTPAEQTEITAAQDPGKTLGFAAFKHTIDAATFEAKFRCLSEERYESFDEAMVASHRLNAVGLVPIGAPEFMLGSRLILAREKPCDTAEWLHLTGSVDALAYNKTTAKLVLIEQKSGFPGASAKFLTQRSLYLKEQHAKQLTLYARMLLAMAEEAHVELYPKDLELVVVANNKSKHLFSVWQMDYDPVTFLGGAWAGERWHGIADLGHLRFEAQDYRPRCRVCHATGEDLIKTKSLPVLIFCRRCLEENRCRCGKVARLESRKQKLKICGKACPVLRRCQPSPAAEGNSLATAIVVPESRLEMIAASSKSVVVTRQIINLV